MIHVETIDNRRYLCSQSHEERTTPNPICDVTDVDPRCVTNALLSLNYGTQPQTVANKSLGQIAYEIWCSLGGIPNEWPSQDQERFESWAIEFRARIYQSLIDKPVSATYDSKTIGGRLRSIDDYQIEAYFPGNQ